MPASTATTGEKASRICHLQLNCNNPQLLAANPAPTVKWQFDSAISADLQTAGSATEAPTEASNRKNPICAPPWRMKHTEQNSCPLLLSKEQRAALCCSLEEGEGRGSNQQHALQSVSISCKRLPMEIHVAATAFFCQCHSQFPHAN